jgi:hypothetical protein
LSVPSTKHPGSNVVSRKRSAKESSPEGYINNMLMTTFLY